MYAEILFSWWKTGLGVLLIVMIVMLLVSALVGDRRDDA